MIVFWRPPNGKHPVGSLSRADVSPDGFVGPTAVEVSRRPGPSGGRVLSRLKRKGSFLTARTRASGSALLPGIPVPVSYRCAFRLWSAVRPVIRLGRRPRRRGSRSTLLVRAANCLFVQGGSRLRVPQRMERSRASKTRPRTIQPMGDSIECKCQGWHGFRFGNPCVSPRPQVRIHKVKFVARF